MIHEVLPSLPILDKDSFPYPRTGLEHSHDLEDSEFSGIPKMVLHSESHSRYLSSLQIPTMLFR
jgi:hypothetical protein